MSGENATHHPLFTQPWPSTTGGFSPKHSGGFNSGPIHTPSVVVPVRTLHTAQQPPYPLPTAQHEQNSSSTEKATSEKENLTDGPHLSEVAMRDHLSTGRAVPLFSPAEVPTGPVRFAGQWWAVLKSAPQLGYTLVDDPAMVGALNDTAQRLNVSV